MIYLTKEDLITASFERFIDESSQDEQYILDNIEAKKIGILKSYLQTRYDVATIFNPDAPMRDEVLVNILVRLVLADTFARNAARKIPVGNKEDAEKAMTELKDIATGRVIIGSLPGAVDGSGNLVSNTIFGNNTNKDFYI